MRQVAARVVAAQFNAAVESISLHSHPGRNGLTWGYVEFQRISGRAGSRGATFVGGHLHEQLGFVDRLDISEFANVMGDFLAVDRCGGCDYCKIVLRYCCVGSGVDGAEGHELPGLDGQWRGHMKPFRYVCNVDPDWSLKVVEPFGLHVKLAAATLGHAIGKTANGELEVGAAWPNGHGVFEILSLETSNIRHTHQVVSISGGSECQL